MARSRFQCNKRPLTLMLTRLFHRSEKHTQNYWLCLLPNGCSEIAACNYGKILTHTLHYETCLLINESIHHFIIFFQTDMSRSVGAKSKYSPEVLAEAAKLVQSGSITLSCASRSYGIPKTTLYDTVKVSGVLSTYINKYSHLWYTRYLSHKITPEYY